MVRSFVGASSQENNMASCMNNVREDLMSECEFEHEREVDSCPRVDISFWGIHFLAIVDTGSMICAISEEVWGQLANYRSQIPCFPCTGVRVTGAFKEKRRVINKQMWLVFSVENREYSHEFLLIPDLAYPVVLGNDWLRRVNARILLDVRVVLVKDGKEWSEIPEIMIKHQNPIEDRALSLTAMSVKNQEFVGGGQFTDRFGMVTPGRNDRGVGSLSETQQRNFVRLLDQHREIFSNRPGKTAVYYHHIRLREDRERNGGLSHVCQHRMYRR